MGEVGDGLGRGEHFRPDRFGYGGSRRGRRNNLHRGDEPVAAPRQRLDVARFIRRVAQRPAQRLDGRVDAVLELDNRVVRPQAPLQLLACHQFARTRQQHGQHFHGLTGKLDLQPMLAQFQRMPVKLEGFEPHQARRGIDSIHGRGSRRRG